MNEKTENKIFVYCLAHLVTGGVELLHQLVHELNSTGYDAYIVYTSSQNVPEEYKKYNIKVATTLEDNETNIIVFSETLLESMLKIKKAKVILWWLSVENFFLSSRRKLALADYYKRDKMLFANVFIYRLKKFFFFENNFFINNVSLHDISNLKVYHCYQSEYAKQFLQYHNINNSFPLTDYLNNDFAENSISHERKDVVLYNPRKGYAFTKKLIEKLPTIRWIPLTKLNRQQLVELFKTSKLYIDFGEHPGKDRLPREAVINGCCIVTGKLGAAKYFEDIPISEYYKLDQKRVPVKQIIQRIIDVVNNYDKLNGDFEAYRSSIKNEPALFKKQVKDLFSKLI